MFQILNFLHSEEGRSKKQEARSKKQEWTRYLCRAVLRASEDRMQNKVVKIDEALMQSDFEGF